MLAMERGEVDGLCGMSWSTIKSTPSATGSQDHSVNFIVQAALKKEPEIASVPLATDLVSNPEQLQITKVLLASQAMARPFAAPPGIPEDRKAALTRRLRRDHERPEFPGRGKKTGLRRASGVRRRQSTRFWRRSTRRRRTSSPRRQRRFRASKAIVSELIGARVTRLEDHTLLTRQRPFRRRSSPRPACCHAAFVRSPHPHALIRGVEQAPPARCRASSPCSRSTISRRCSSSGA